MVTVAVDAGGADLGPRRSPRARRVPPRRASACSCSARPSEIGSVGDGVEVVDAPVSIAKAADPAFAVRSTPEASIVQAAKAVADGRAQALVSGGSTGSALAAGLFNLRRDRGIYRPALALPVPMPGAAPVLLLDVGANVTCRPEHLVQFAHMGSAFAQAVMGIGSPRVALLSNGEEPAKGTPELVDGPRAARRRGRNGPELHRQHRGNPGHRRRRRRRRDGRVHRQHHAEADRGRLRAHDARDPRRGAELCPRQARRLAAVAGGPQPARRDRSRGPRRRVHARACASSASSPTAGSRGEASRARSRWRARGVQEDVIGRTRAALVQAGALRSVPADHGRRRRPRPSRRLRCRADESRAGLLADPRAPGRRARGGSRDDPGVDALQGGSRSRFARPVHARPGARGQLRREDLRRGGGEDPDRRSGGRLRAREWRRAPSATASQGSDPE